MKYALPSILRLGAVAAVLSACSSPCGDLADRACQRAGEADPLCQHLRKVAEHATAQDREACRAGHAFADEMEKR